MRKFAGVVVGRERQANCCVFRCSQTTRMSGVLVHFDARAHTQARIIALCVGWRCERSDRKRESRGRGLSKKRGTAVAKNPPRRAPSHLSSGTPRGKGCATEVFIGWTGARNDRKRL